MLLYLSIELYLSKKGFNWLLLSQIEQDQVRYLIGILIPFAIYTQSIGRTLSPTIQFVFPIYNKLLIHLEDTRKRLGRKQAPWK